MADSVKKELAKVIMLGEMGVGKTTLLNGYVGAAGAGKAATMGPDFKQKSVRIGTTECNLQIWDTAGQE